MYVRHHGKPFETCMQGYEGDKIIPNFIDESCSCTDTTRWLYAQHVEHIFTMPLGIHFAHKANLGLGQDIVQSM